MPSTDHGQQCKLCLAGPTQLRKSHIVPSWAYRRARSAAKNPNPVLVEKGRAAQVSRQHTERMLCGTCEQRLGVHEKYAATLAYRQDETAALFGCIERRYSDASLRASFAEPVRVDIESLVQFGSSVLWRAHVSRHAPKCHLGERYGEQFRRYLIGEAAFPENAAVALFFLEDEPGSQTARVSRASAMPQSQRRQGFYTHRVLICGLQFEFAVGQAIDDVYRLFCLVRGKHRAIILWPSDSAVNWFALSARVASKRLQSSSHR